MRSRACFCVDYFDFVNKKQSSVIISIKNRVSSCLFPQCGQYKTKLGAKEGDRGGLDLCTAIGSSHDPGTLCTTMLDSLTPQASSLAFVPARSGSMMVSFQRACTMPMRRAEPSCCCGVGPLVCIFGVFWCFSLDKGCFVMV